MTVDLFEAKSLKSVAVCLREVKRLSGGGFEKQKAGEASAAPAIDFAKDDSTDKEVNLSETPTTLNIANGDVKRIGQAQMAGHAKLSAQTGSQKCDVCTKPISGGCIAAVGRTFHSKCFLCRRCNIVLAEKKFYVHNNKQYCDRCILIENKQTNVRAHSSQKANLFSQN